MKICKIQVNLDGSLCELQWTDGHVGRFHAKWLRFNCRCNKCLSPFPGVYKINIPWFPKTMHIVEASIIGKGVELCTKYDGDINVDHVGIHSSEWLRSKCYCDECLEAKTIRRDVIQRYVISDDCKHKKVPTLDYSEIVDDTDRGVFNLTRTVVEAGLCLVQNAPCEMGMVVQFAKKIANIDPSTYGEIFDVFARDSENIAYTDLELPLHQDQVHYEAAPGIQMLHVLRFDECVTGGESMLVDMFEAVEVLREESSADFMTLAEVPATFITDYDTPQAGRYFEHQKYHIQLDYFGKVVGVNWNAATISAPQVRGKDVERYYKAYVAFSNIIRRKSIQYRFKMKQGDLLVFNNRRMTHAREAFQTNGGERHLQGTYQKLDDFKSKYIVLCRKFGLKVEPPKMGNNSSF